METPGKTLFVNANLVLDGCADLQQSFEVLVQGNRIVAVSQTRLNPHEVQIIDVRGKTLMPGLIDAHAHITGLSLSPRNSAYPVSEITAAAATYLRCSLMDGFTSLREAGGADRNVARLLAEGKIIGPRLFYSGRALTQTGGGADFRSPDEVTDACGHPGPLSGMSVIADGIDEVRKAAREELRRGAASSRHSCPVALFFPPPRIPPSTNTPWTSCARSWKRRRAVAPTSWRTSTPTKACAAACLPASGP